MRIKETELCTAGSAGDCCCFHYIYELSSSVHTHMYAYNNIVNTHTHTRAYNFIFKRTVRIQNKDNAMCSALRFWFACVFLCFLFHFGLLFPTQIAIVVVFVRPSPFRILVLGRVYWRYGIFSFGILHCTCSMLLTLQIMHVCVHIRCRKLASVKVVCSITSSKWDSSYDGNEVNGQHRKRRSIELITHSYTCNTKQTRQR